MENSKNIYLRYMREVLGVSGVVLPESVPSHGPAMAERAGSAAPDADHRPSGEGLEAAGVPGWLRIATGSEAKVAFVAASAQDWPLGGEAGDLLQRMTQAMKLDGARIATVELNLGEAGGGHLPDAEARLLRLTLSRDLPAMIVTLGAAATSCVRAAFGEPTGDEDLFGRWWEVDGLKIMPTFSLPEMLKTPQVKKTVWLHLQAVMKELS